jgi:hypothetical protein
MQEVDSAKCASHEGIYALSMEMDLGMRTAMGEHRMVAKLSKGKLTVVAVSTEVFHGVQRLTKTSQSLAEVIFVSFLGTAGVKTTIVDASGEAVSQISGAGCPITILVRDIVFHASSRVNFGFYFLNGPSQTLIKSPRINSISVTERIIDVFFWTIDAEAIRGHFEFAGGIAVSHERENPNLSVK